MEMDDDARNVLSGNGTWTYSGQPATGIPEKLLHILSAFIYRVELGLNDRDVSVLEEYLETYPRSWTL